MEAIASGITRTHKINILGRQTANISGVTDVIAFDEKEVVLDTEKGMLTLKGEELHMSRLSLDKGEVDMEGRIDTLQYSDSTGKRGGMGGKEESFLAKLFR